MIARVTFDRTSPLIAQYCRWLTEKVGLTQSDQAYADPKTLDKSQYPLDGDVGLPKNWPLNLDNRGFRLPTESEWEIAARAGMQTNYGFGNDESWLESYAWLQTNSGEIKWVKPNTVRHKNCHRR